MGMIKEFKEFAIKGNALDLAVGVIIGGAFGKIVSSIIDDLLMPIVSGLIGSPDFSSLYVVLKGTVPAGTKLEEARKIADTAIFAYGNFITELINFLILAWVVFLMVKAINRIKKNEEAAAPAEPSSTDKLLMEIRDSLKK
ncbi:MAG: large conductance mechanosensitive channel protein MscL [Niabella sp.]